MLHHAEIPARLMQAIPRAHLRSVNAVECRRRIEESHRSVRGDSEVEVIVLCPTSGDFRLEGSGLLEPFTSDDRSRRMHEVATEHLVKNVDHIVVAFSKARGHVRGERGKTSFRTMVCLEVDLAVGGVISLQVTLSENFSGGSECAHIRPDEADLGMAAKNLDLGGELPRPPAVVGVQEGNEFAARQLESEIAGRREPAVRLVEIANAGIGVLRYHVRRAIRRSIVDYDC